MPHLDRLSHCLVSKVVARALLAQPHIFRATADRLTQVRLCSSIKRPHKRKSKFPKKIPNLFAFSFVVSAASISLWQAMVDQTVLASLARPLVAAQLSTLPSAPLVTTAVDFESCTLTSHQFTHYLNNCS